MMYVLSQKSDELREIISCKITHKMLDFAKAEVRLTQNADFDYGEYISLVDEQKRAIFHGYVECIQNNSTLNLRAAPHDVEKSVRDARKMANPISKLQKNHPITWSAVDNVAREFFDTGAVFDVTDRNVLDLKPLEINIQKNYVFDLLVRWNNYVHENLDMGEKIFAGATLDTFTVDAIRNDWPTINGKVGDFYVKDSALEVVATDVVEAENDMIEQHKLSGVLFLQRLVEQNTDETWEINLHNASQVTKRIPLYLDLSKYIENYPRWSPDVMYREDDRVLSPVEMTLLKAKQDHVSGAEYDENQWEELENEFRYDNEDFLLESSLGEHVAQEILRTISLYMLSQDPEVVFEFTGDWEYWKNLDIYNPINVRIDGQNYVLRIMDYTKVFQYGKKLVKVKCAGYKKQIKPSELTLRIRDKTLEESSPRMFQGHKISVQNEAKAQLESYPKIKPTRIDYKFKSGQAYRVTKAKINLDWNLA